MTNKIRFPEKRYGVVPTTDFQLCLQRWIFDEEINLHSHWSCKYLCNRSYSRLWRDACKEYLTELSELNDGGWKPGNAIGSAIAPDLRPYPLDPWELFTRTLRLDMLDWLAAYFGEPK